MNLIIIWLIGEHANKIGSFSFSIDQLVCLSFNNEEIIQLETIQSIELDTEMIATKCSY